MLKREELPIICICPICSQVSRIQDVTPNGEVVSAMQDINDSIAIYDSYIAPYKCHNGHTFYISYEKN
jgi:hypothetical protein